MTNDTTNSTRYFIKEAATYCNLTVPGVRHHVYNVGDLRATGREGNKIFFSKEELDRFNLARKAVGRPPQI